MTLGKRLRAARKEKGLTQRALAEQIGAKHNSISNWENDQNRPDPIVLETLCHVLEVTADYLLLGEEREHAPEAPQLTEEEWSIIHKFRQLDRDGQAAVRALIAFAILPQEAERSRCSAGQRPVLESIPGLISTQSAAAGTGTFLEQDSFETIRLVKNDMTSRAAFYVPVAGDSMEPRYRDGDILMIEKAPVHRGEIGIFTLDGKGYVKMLGDGELLSLNPAYGPIAMHDDIVCNGRVIGTLDAAWIAED